VELFDPSVKINKTNLSLPWELNVCISLRDEGEEIANPLKKCSVSVLMQKAWIILSYILQFCGAKLMLNE
jgi:hypothetical protein